MSVFMSSSRNVHPMFTAHTSPFSVCCFLLLPEAAFAVSSLLIFEHSLPVVVFFGVEFPLPSSLCTQIGVMWRKSLIFLKLPYFSMT